MVRDRGGNVGRTDKAPGLQAKKDRAHFDVVAMGPIFYCFENAAIIPSGRFAPFPSAGQHALRSPGALKTDWQSRRPPADS